MFPPAETNKPGNSQRCKSEVNNAGIQSFGRALSQLLRRAGANRTLGVRFQRSNAETKDEKNSH